MTHPGKTTLKPPEYLDERHGAKWVEVCEMMAKHLGNGRIDPDLITEYTKQWFVAFDAWNELLRINDKFLTGQVRLTKT